MFFHFSREFKKKGNVFTPLEKSVSMLCVHSPFRTIACIRDLKRDFYLFKADFSESERAHSGCYSLYEDYCISNFLIPLSAITHEYSRGHVVFQIIIAR